MKQNYMTVYDFGFLRGGFKNEYDYLILTLVIHISIPSIIQNFDFV